MKEIDAIEKARRSKIQSTVIKYNQVVLQYAVGYDAVDAH